ncbi:MAG: sigma-54-dependent Fis family transcriptional regulator [Gammaproteobacteria bacterium 28-57-27]|nr:MAG: sigma-54-dependent Fis family transcriptional regulator [Gammaproteobacteria bacterium 28-57-27]
MHHFSQLMTQSPMLETVIRSAQIVARTDVSVMLTGETGTGKDLMAQAIHHASPRAQRPFIAINCAALPETLVESELFGHKRGAFTGATEDRLGHIRSAHGGTLFLDEVGELPLAAQAKLLRFLESGDIIPVGESHTIKVDARIIAATHQDLSQLVRESRFREDLFYRLQIVPMEMPSLRERSGDIDMLLNRFLLHFAGEHQLPLPKLAQEVRSALRRHGWPGNVRELRNLCERLVVLFHGRTVELGNLPAEITRSTQPMHSALGLSSTHGRGFSLPEEGIDLEWLESDIIRQALDRARGNKSRAARLLGITRDTLLYRLKKFDLA